MDVSTIGSLSSAMSQTQTSQQASMLVLKKAIDIEAQGTLQLLQGVPQAPSNPANLGNGVDVTA